MGPQEGITQSADTPASGAGLSRRQRALRLWAALRAYSRSEATSKVNFAADGKRRRLGWPATAISFSLIATRYVPSL